MIGLGGRGSTEEAAKPATSVAHFGGDGDASPPINGATEMIVSHAEEDLRRGMDVNRRKTCELLLSEYKRLAK
jgi:hypothetical protein